MTFHKPTLVLLGLAWALLCSGSIPQSADQLFQAAVYQEEVEGNLKGAIETYQMVLNRFPADRSMGARALLRIGLCHLKLGHKEAQGAFQKVIDDYSDQAETVRLAREQLSVLMRAQTLLTKGDQEYRITKLHTDTRDGWLSPDATRLVLIDSEKNTLWLKNIVSGKEVCLVPTPEKITDCLWSPDSKLIAYRTGDASVKIVSADGGQPKTIIENSPEMKKAGDQARPAGWTADSKKLVFQVGAQGLYAIPASGGQWEEIYKFPDPQKAKERKERLTLSHDRKFIACESTQDGNTDIYVMPARGGVPVRITDYRGTDWGPKWSYDDQWLAFGSARSGDSGIWVVRITPDGKPGSRAIQAVPEGYWNWVWTQDGKIAHQTSLNLAQVFVANVDGSQEVALTKPDYQSGYPRWSPDGKTLVYSRNHVNYGAQTRNTRFDIRVVPANGGEEKFLATGTVPVWSPNGREIAFSNERFGAKATISIIPAEGGEAREIMNYDGYVMLTDWSPGGEHLAFMYGMAAGYKNPIPDSKSSSLNIYIVSAKGGEPKRLTRIDKVGVNLSTPRWSPDGRKIAFLQVNASDSEPGAGIYIMDAYGGTPKLVAADERAWYGLCWSTDGKSIIFSKTDKEAEGGWRLYRVSANGGKAEKLNIMGKAPDLSPDGKKIAFYRSTGTRNEFWLAENFLPVDKKEK